MIVAQFLLAFAVFLALHSVPAVPAVRQRLVDLVGRKTYLVLYSLVSLLVLAWVFHATLTAEYVPLWEPAAWQAWVTLIAAPVGIFFVLAGLISANPLSVSARAGDTAGAIVAITRHPVLWGFFLWSAGHMVPNGDLRSLVLFGGFAVFAAAGVFTLDRRARKRLGAEWSQKAASTSILPFGAVLSGRASIAVDRPMAVAAILTAALAWLLLAGGHGLLFGADPLLLAFSGI